jgi:hypothetical protein
VVVRLRTASDPTRVRVGVAPRDAVDEPIGLVATVLPGDCWSDVEVPLTRAAVDGERLLVNVTVEEPGRAVDVQRIALT